MSRVSVPTLAHAVLDALQGMRALHQIRPHLSPRAFQQLVSYPDAANFRIGRVGPFCVQHPVPNSLEASGTVRIRDRWLTCIIRLNRRDNWKCSNLRAVGFLA